MPRPENATELNVSETTLSMRRISANQTFRGENVRLVIDGPSSVVSTQNLHAILQQMATRLSVRSPVAERSRSPISVQNQPC